MAKMDLPAPNSRARPPWFRLLPLAAVVLAAHLLLLQGSPRRVRPASPPPGQPGARSLPVPFATRSLVPPRPPLASAAPAPAEAGPPSARPAAALAQPVARRRPALPVRRAAAAASPIPARPAPPADPAPTPPTPAVALPAPMRLHYELSVHKGGLTLAGRALLEWHHDGQAYEARLESSGASGQRVQRSSGRVGAEGLLPGYFADKARGEQATHFDRANGRLVFSNNRPQAPLAAGMQDRLSVMLQLAALVAGAPARYPPGTRIAIPTATAREADTWAFTVEAVEELDLPGGTLPALKLQRLPRHEYDQKVELWLAPGLDYAPVRLRLTNPNGDTADQRWSATDKG